MTKPPPVPEGYGTVTPWVVTKDTRRLLEFTEGMRYVQSTVAPGLDAS